MGVNVFVNPQISPDALWDFYVRNDICEVGHGKEIATKVLDRSSVIVAAFDGEKLVGITRAMFDGLEACIMEFSLERELQGEMLKYENGSLLESDLSGVGKAMGEALLQELYRLGATFIFGYIVAGKEETFYQSLGFRENTGHLMYIIDKRPYVPGNERE